MAQDVRVRIAPSPTGYLPIHTVRTAIFNWLFAKQHEGTFLLRIEDTDKERSTKEFEDDIIRGLKLMDLEWDEFYRQSDRLPIYRKYIEQLLEQKKAFWCYHTSEELEVERQKQAEAKELPRHVCEFKYAEHPKKKSYTSGVIRLAVNENSDRKIAFSDIIRGKVEFDERLLGDISIARSLDDPLYHLVVVIDDYEMNISHIIRGEDHLANTPKHILIQEALGFDMPLYAHVPLVLAPDRSKLSKRHGAVALSEFFKLGYLSDALFNYFAILGFTPAGDKEILSRDELVKLFDLAKVHKSGAIFDTKKLDWINGEYIKAMPDEILQKHLLPFIEEAFGGVDPHFVLKALPLMRDRLKKLSDVQEFPYFFKEPDYEAELLKWKDHDIAAIRASLEKTKSIIEADKLEQKDGLRAQLDDLAKEIGDRGLAYWPLRVALTGAKASPDPVDVAFLLGKQRSLARIGMALEKLA